MKTFTTIFFFLSLTNIIAQENTLGTIFITEEVDRGLVLFSSKFDTYLIDNCGNVVNRWSSNYKIGQSAYLLENGKLIRTGNQSEIGNTTGGIIQLFDWSGNLIWQDKFNTDSLSLHHDIEPLPNGNILAIGYRCKSKQQAWDSGAQDSIDYLTTEIIEIKPIGSDSSEIVWKWEIWDHLIQEIDSTRSNFGIVDQNPQLFDINSRIFLEPGENGSVYSDLDADLMHLNSIDYNPETDEILLSSRDQYEIYIIDHSTTTTEAASHEGGNNNKGGDFLYRFGTDKFYGQHDAQWIGVDTIIVFNNGFRYDEASRGYASVDKIIPGEYGQVELYEEVISSQSLEANFYSQYMGSAQILSNGNVLVCDSDDGMFYEFNDQNELLWAYANPLTWIGPNSQGNQASSTPLIFRAKKVSKNDERLIGLDLTPGNPIELDFNVDMCLEITNVTNVLSNKDIKLFPNPVTHYLEIESNVDISQIYIYNSSGKLLIQTDFEPQIQFANYTNGLYYVKIIDSSGRIKLEKILKL